MAFFGIGQKKDNIKTTSSGTRSTAAQNQLTQGAKGSKTISAQRPTTSAHSLSTVTVEEAPLQRNPYAPIAKVPGDAAFLSPMGDVNQPTAVYQQHLARQWQHKAAERAEMRQAAAYEDSAMVVAQSLRNAGVSSEKQWPIMPIQFQIEHFDITNTRFHTMFTHLGIGKSFFETVVAVYLAALEAHQEDTKKPVKKFRAEDWEQVGNRATKFCNGVLATRFTQLMRIDYKWSNFQKSGKYILTYPLRPEDTIAWCETHKVPYLTAEGRAVWAEYKAKLQSGEMIGE